MTTGNVSDCGSHCNDNKTERKRNGQCRQRKGRGKQQSCPAAENHKNHCAEKFGSKFSDQGRDFTCHDNASESQ